MSDYYGNVAGSLDLIGGLFVGMSDDSLKKMGKQMRVYANKIIDDEDNAKLIREIQVFLKKNDINGILNSRDDIYLHF